MSIEISNSDTEKKFDGLYHFMKLSIHNELYARKIAFDHNGPQHHRKFK